MFRTRDVQEPVALHRLDRSLRCLLDNELVAEILRNIHKYSGGESVRYDASIADPGRVEFTNDVL